MVELATYLPYLVNRLGQRFVSELSTALATQGVGVQDWRVLIVLYQRGEQAVGSLSKLTSINMSTLSRLISRMADRGLVERCRGYDDARSVTVKLTETGTALTEKILPSATSIEDNATQEFTEAELATLRQLLVKLYSGTVTSRDVADDRLAG